MAHSSDTQTARRGLQRNLHRADALEQRLQDCDNRQLCSTLRKIHRSKLRQSAGFVTWLQGRAAGFAADAPIAEPAKASTLSESVAASASAPGDGEIAVIERRQVSGDLIILKVQRPPGFEFLPGQSTKLELANLRRRYSIASAPAEHFLEFFIELVPGGQMSGQLLHLKTGDRLGIEAPKGGFLLADKYSTHLMIATVTGISPFISMLRQHFRAETEGVGRHRFIVLQGASYQDEFGYREELEQLVGAFPEQITYIPTISRAGEERNTGWSGEQGRVGTVAEKYLERFALDAQFTCVYACGNPDMVDGIEQQFRAEGFTVRTERYD